MKPSIKHITPYLTLKAIKTDKFKTERISINFENKIDKYKMPLSLLAFSILKRGTEKYVTLKELNKKLDELYATIISMNVQRLGKNYLLGFSAEMLGDQYVEKNTDLLRETVDIIHEMLYRPLLSEGFFIDKYVESEKENMIDAINARINNPRAYATSRCIEIMYKNDEFSIEQLGNVDIVSSFTKEEVTNEYRTIISRCPITVFYIGSRDIQDIQDMIIDIFNDNHDAPILCGDNSSDFNIDTKRTKYVTENMDIAQGKLVLGFKSGVNLTCEKDFYPMLVLNEIFGGSPISKLFLNVRERLGLCYYCSSSYSVTKGAIMVSCGIEPSDKRRAQGEILKQLRDIKKGKISEEEFSSAIKSLLNGYSETYDYPSRIESFYELRSAYYIDDTVDDCKIKLLDVSVEDVIRVANKIKLDTVYFLYGDGEGDTDD